jgi:RimJ/RimL family protein N-acetyltransferase
VPILAALEWVGSRGTTRRLMLEMQPKNHAAINLAQKLGFDYCGYVDHYYVNHDISIFFSKWIA